MAHDYAFKLQATATIRVTRARTEAEARKMMAAFMKGRGILVSNRRNRLGIWTEHLRFDDFAFAEAPLVIPEKEEFRGGGVT